MKVTAAISLCVISCVGGWTQEASSGLDIHGTVSALANYSHALTSAPRSGDPATAGLRAVFYPTWKLSEHWSVSGSIQVESRPYNKQEFSTQGYGLKADVLQLNLAYSRYWNSKSLVFRVGELSSAFGSFLLRYDDAVNPLIDIPLTYGYYGNGITTAGLTGAQVDATAGKFDARAQFVNSSPANRRSMFSRDQYGNWVGGIGYTIRQGFRIGIAAYRGPYLDRHYAYYFPGEAKPRDLPGTGYGLEVQWGRGPWTAYGELQKFQFDYRLIPTFYERAGYAELRRVLAPRWYVATRVGFIRTNASPPLNEYQTAVGFRPNRHQLLKIGYEIEQSPFIRGTLANTFALQLVTTFRLISIARD